VQFAGKRARGEPGKLSLVRRRKKKQIHADRKGDGRRYFSERKKSIRGMGLPPGADHLEFAGKHEN